MKTILLILLLSTASPAAPIDRTTTKQERQIVQLIYSRWTFRWGGTPRQEQPSTALYLMLSVGQGHKLTSIEQQILKRIETINRKRQ